MLAGVAPSVAGSTPRGAPEVSIAAAISSKPPRPFRPRGGGSTAGAGRAVLRPPRGRRWALGRARVRSKQIEFLNFAQVELREVFLDLAADDPALALGVAEQLLNPVRQGLRHAEEPKNDAVIGIVAIHALIDRRALGLFFERVMHEFERRYRRLGENVGRGFEDEAEI